MHTTISSYEIVIAAFESILQVCSITMVPSHKYYIAPVHYIVCSVSHKFVFFL